MFSAVLDTSVIFPARLTDTLLSCAQQGLYYPLWSEAIVQELREAQSRAYPHRDPRLLESRIMAMCRAFPAATVMGWERMADDIAPVIPDEYDAHVIAAARTGGAEVIVTNNLKDFPSTTLASWSLSAMSADEFLVRLWRSDPSAGREALRVQSRRMLRPPLSPEEIVDQLADLVPEFSRLARATLIA